MQTFDDVGGLHKDETLMNDYILHVDAFKHITPYMLIIFETLNKALKDLCTTRDMTNLRRMLMTHVVVIYHIEALGKYQHKSY